MLIGRSLTLCFTNVRCCPVMSSLMGLFCPGKQTNKQTNKHIQTDRQQQQQQKEHNIRERWLLLICIGEYNYKITILLDDHVIDPHLSSPLTTRDPNILRISRLAFSSLCVCTCVCMCRYMWASVVCVCGGGGGGGG